MHVLQKNKRGVKCGTIQPYVFLVERFDLPGAEECAPRTHEAVCPMVRQKYRCLWPAYGIAAWRTSRLPASQDETILSRMRALPQRVGQRSLLTSAPCLRFLVSACTSVKGLEGESTPIAPSGCRRLRIYSSLCTDARQQGTVSTVSEGRHQSSSTSARPTNLGHRWRA